MTGKPIVVENAWQRQQKQGIALVEVAVVGFMLNGTYWQMMPRYLSSLFHYGIVCIMAGGVFLIFQSRVRSQELKGFVFHEHRRRDSLMLDLLSEPDLTIRISQTGDGSIGYWRKGQQTFIRVLPDPSGAMLEALARIGKQLPEGNFLDERLAAIQPGGSA